MTRGSLTDVINLADYPFVYEPVTRDKETCGFAVLAVFGNRLPQRLWIGQGETCVELDVFLLGPNTQIDIDNFKRLKEPQADIGAPHPLYINVAGMYVGRQFVLCEIETKYTGLNYSSDMAPYEAYLHLKLIEIPTDGKYAGTGR